MTEENEEKTYVSSTFKIVLGSCAAVSGGVAAYGMATGTPVDIPLVNEALSLGQLEIALLAGPAAVRGIIGGLSGVINGEVLNGRMRSGIGRVFSGGIVGAVQTAVSFGATYGVVEAGQYIGQYFN